MTGWVHPPDRPRIAAFRGHVYVAWRAVEAGTGQLMFRRSTNYGTSFHPQIALGEAIPSDFPQIAASGFLDVTIAFVNSDRQTVLASSADGGKTWPNKVVIPLAGKAREETVGRLGEQIVAGWSQIVGTENFRLHRR